MYTGQQKSLEQPKFCSSLIDKIWSHKRSPDVRDRGKSPEKKKLKSESSEKNDLEKGNQKSEIASITNKLKRVTSTLPWALQSKDAYETGEKNCEVCLMTREKYKFDLRSAKVVGILVDGVVEKEQTEKMDDENEQEEFGEGKDRSSKDNGKGDKLSFNLSIYCEGDVVKHNLKCVLIKLQKTLGDVMVQICFVKTRKLGNEEKYKKFNVSTSDLKLLKYEYTNLTDAIIPLFKNSSAKRKGNTEVCVACVKEKLSEYNLRLGEILKSGRNLRIVMRNDAASRDTDKCCSRDYPHVHAEVQGKPIVLKYSMPFQVKHSSKLNRPSDEEIQKDPDRRLLTDEETLGQQPKEASPIPKKLYSQQEVPYYEWPEDFGNQDNKHKDPNDVSSLSVSPERKDLSDSESLDSLKDKPKVPSSFIEASKSLEPRDDVNYSNPNFNPQPSETSMVSTSVSSSKSKESNIPNASSPLAMSPKTTTQVAAPVLSTSLISEPPKKSKKNISFFGESISTDSDYFSIQTKNSTESSMYCGCNYDEAFKKLGPIPKSQPNPKKQMKDDSLSSVSESTVSFLKDDTNKKKDETFPYKFDKTTAFPVSTIQSSNLMFPKQKKSKLELADRQSSHTQENVKNTYDACKIHSGEDKDNISLAVSQVDSLVLTKERLLHGDTSRSSFKMSVSSQDKAVAAAFKTFIDEPKYEIRSVVTTKENPTKPLNNISHQNMKLELLKHLGRENLMSVCSPAECCKANNEVDGKSSYSELPLSPSLYSLPLDHTDLEYLAKATGQPISYEDIMLLAEEEIPAKNDTWEIQYADNSDDQHKPKWLRAFGATDKQKETHTNVPTTQTTSAIRRSSVKSVVIKDEPRLSTIVEEGPFCFSEDESPSIPYMPSIPSLPLDEEEKSELIKKHRPSILKHTTMELRYFTVEFPENVNISKQKKPKCDEESKKFNNNVQQKNKLSFGVRSGNEVNEVSEKGAVSKDDVNKKSCESFHSCSSSTELMNVNYDKMERKPMVDDKELKIKADEMTMLNAIYLCDKSFDCYKSVNSFLKSYKTIISKNCVKDIVHNNTGASTPNPHFPESKISYLSCIPEINDCYVKKLISNLDKTQYGEINKSFTIFKNTENIIDVCDRMGDTNSLINSVKNVSSFDNACPDIKNKKKQRWEPNRTANCSYSNNPSLNKALKADSKNNSATNLNIENKKTKDNLIISMSENTPKYISVKLNQSYTVIKDSNQCTNSNNSFLYKLDNKPQQSYTVIDEKETGRTNRTAKDIIEKEPITINYSDMKNDNTTLTSQVASLKCRTNYSPQYIKCKQSHWSKLKLDKPNLKNYLIEQRKDKKITSTPKYTMKPFKDSKRKPLILPQSRLSCRRTQCKVTLPRTYFPNLQPLRINYRIPSITFEQNKLNHIFEQFEESNEAKQQSGTTGQTQNLSTLMYVENTYKNILKSESEQKDENKGNFSVVNLDRAITRNFSKKPVDDKSQHSRPSVNNKTENCYSNNLNFKIPLVKDKSSTGFFTVKSSTNLKCSQVNGKDCKSNEHLLLDQDNNPLYLFDCHGRPLTDQSGRTLRNIQGEFLIIFDKQNNPISDMNNNPICDSLGRILNKKGFNSIKPPTEDVLKSFLRDCGDPILLYDVEGRPLTSVSGTMLVDSSGKSLIRFGCTDKLVCDSAGRPIFNSIGEQFYGIG